MLVFAGMGLETFPGIRILFKFPFKMFELGRCLAVFADAVLGEMVCLPWRAGFLENILYSVLYDPYALASISAIFFSGPVARSQSRPKLCP